MKEFLCAVLIFVAVVVGFFSLGFGMVAYDCGNYSDVTGRETKYSFGTCYVKTERGFIPQDELKARSVTNE